MIWRLERADLIVYTKIPKTYDPAPLVLPTSVLEKFQVLVDRLRSLQNFNDEEKSRKIILEFLHENPEVVNYIKTAAVTMSAGIIISTLVEDFLTVGAGIADDIACFYMAYKIFRIGVLL